MANKNHLRTLCIAATALFFSGISCEQPKPQAPPVQESEPTQQSSEPQTPNNPPESSLPETSPSQPSPTEPTPTEPTPSEPAQPIEEPTPEQPPIQQPEPAPEQPINPINHPLISTPDESTTLDESLAGKVRRVAQYVIDNMDNSEIVNNGVKIYDNNFKIDKKFYTVWVYNFDETKPDMIVVFEYDPKISIKEEIISFVDNGLDGRVNEGHNAYREKFHSEASEKKHFVKESQEGLEFEIEFQNKYEIILDKLLKFYESDERK